MNQRQLRLKSMVQACPKWEYKGEIYERSNYAIAPQIESDYSFEGNWWYIWFKGDLPIAIGDTIIGDRKYIVSDIHLYKNYKRGSLLLK